MSTDSDGDLVGTLYLESPSQRFTVRGYCDQSGSTAEFTFNLNGAAVPYVGEIFFGDDGRVYLDGEKEGTNIDIFLRRD